MHRFTFDSPYTFGDQVEYTAPHASGRGRVLDIVLCEDRRVYYIVQPDDGDADGGIFPEHMRPAEGGPQS
ncbi:hypothetical protein [Urbifossiella limnaea]|uniref:Uncharacterized protein n=1 Tax=Urbifossiella limnaea TaxID=2528023 RepID=A0A517XWG7_9BACT|nr:hypothetical protein [Urbifossiella limnaea]QDU21838.1 hypothetical protein ETAA1_38110 [Urbifossiella limnaea]